jgi:diguanylate cyclase (GGDEF)-like protein
VTSLNMLRRFSHDERAYLYARVVLLGVLGLLYGLDLLNPAQIHREQALLVATAIFALGTVIFFAVVWGDSGRFNLALQVVLPTDLVVVGLLTFAGAYDDAFYPLCILIPVMYALLVGKREAWMVGALTALAYVLGHSLDSQITASQFTVLAVKTLFIPLICIIVADSVDRQRRRGEEARRSATERDEMNARLQRRIAELRTLSQITEIMHASLELDDAATRVLDVISKAIGVESCCLYVVDRSKSETIFSAGVGPACEPQPAAPAVGAFQGSGDEPWVCISVFEDSRDTVLFCAPVADIATLGEEDRLVLGAVASELIVAVENSGLFKLAQRLAITDELTGLYNYRHLQTRLDLEVGRAVRYGHAVSLLMIDVDGFKSFNDSYGHRAGDVALAEVGEVLCRSVRDVDLVARYGGEEFAVVLPETDGPGALVVADKIREAVSERSFADADGVRCCQLTVSAGLATLPTHASDKESLLRESDDALYNAKSGGKNRVMMTMRTASSSAGSAEIHDSTGA